MPEQDYRISTARKMSVDIDVAPDLLLLFSRSCVSCSTDKVVFLIPGIEIF